MHANSHEPWSETEITDLTNELARGRTIEESPLFFVETWMMCDRRLKNWDWPNSAP
jgi:hypothetical protein